MKSVFLDALYDSLMLLPFLFITFLVLELFEHKVSEKGKKFIKKSGRFGPFFGTLFGMFPQCGFGVFATNFYVARIISLGTLFSVYLATSDEMLPLLIAEKVSMFLILKILLIKFIFGIIIGFIIDLIIRKREDEKYDICVHDDCKCEENLLVACLRHTFNIFLFIIVCNFIIGFIIEEFGVYRLESFMLKGSVFSYFLTPLIGLIPNCASSVMLVELYLNGAVNFGSLMGGLLSCCGVSILVLFKEYNLKGSVKILFGLYAIGVVSGTILGLIF